MPLSRITPSTSADLHAAWNIHKSQFSHIILFHRDRSSIQFYSMANAASVKVFCCSSADQLEALQHIHQKEGIPPVPLDLDHIMAKAEQELGSSKDVEWYTGCAWQPLTSIHQLALYQRLNSFQYMHVLPIRVPSNYDESSPAFVKVYCCSSADQLEALQHIHQKEGIPPVPLDLDHIKAKAEQELGSSKDVEWYTGCEWQPLTSIHQLALYQRLNSFQYMHVVPIRVPSNYDECCPAFVKVYCCSSADQLEALQHIHQKEGIPPVPLDLDHIKAKAEQELGSSKDVEWYTGCEWQPLTSIHQLALYQRLNSFQYMHVVPIRVSGYDSPCIVSSQQLEPLMDEMNVLAISDNIEAKVEDDHETLEDALGMEWEVL
jgi:hypothetical protein